MHAVASGTVSEGDLFQYQQAILDDKAMGTRMLELIDFTGADADAISRAAIERLAEIEGQNKEFFAGWKTAFVVREQLHYGLTRMFLAYATLEGSTIRNEAFLQMEEARRWLEITPEDLSQPELKVVN